MDFVQKMHRKQISINVKILLTSIILIFLLLVICSSQIDKKTLNSGEILTATLSPPFYSYVYLLQNNQTIDIIKVDCDVECKEEKKLEYDTSSLAGKYQLAVFNYETEEYEYLDFKVIKTEKEIWAKLIINFIN